MVEFTSYQLLGFACILLTVGVFSGIISGLLGVGGGIVIVPVLFHIFPQFGFGEDISMHMAVGTSLASIIVTSIFSSRAHYKRGNVDPDLIRAWTPAITIGVIAGAALASSVRGIALVAFFATIAFIVALYMGIGSAQHKIAASPPGGIGKHVMAGTIGMVSSMMGIGGGTLGVPILSLFGVPIHRAVGSSSALGLIIGIPGTAVFIASGWVAPGRPPFSVGYVNLLALFILLPASMYFAPVGARLAHKLNPAHLRKAFAVFLGVTAVRMFYSVFL